MRDSEERTKDYKNGTLNLCICYNSKHEIFEATEKLALRHSLDPNYKINTENFEKELYGGKNLAPDILIRTSNEVRLSNFMLYQTDKSKFFFIKVLWPDFTFYDFMKVILHYQAVVAE